MGGGNSSTSAAYDMCFYENRQLYYYINETSLSYDKKIINLKQK